MYSFVGESLESTRLCKSCLLEPLSGPDHCDPKVKVLYARKQASESSQDAVQQLARGLRGVFHRSIGAWERGAQSARGRWMTRRRFIIVAEAAEVLDIAVEAVGGRIKRATLASPDP